jgi:hypothetical protein
MSRSQSLNRARVAFPLIATTRSVTASSAGARFSHKEVFQIARCTARASGMARLRNGIRIAPQLPAKPAPRRGVVRRNITHAQPPAQAERICRSGCAESKKFASVHKVHICVHSALRAAESFPSPEHRQRFRRAAPVRRPTPGAVTSIRSPRARQEHQLREMAQKRAQVDDGTRQ